MVASPRVDQRRDDGSGVLAWQQQRRGERCGFAMGDREKEEKKTGGAHTTSPFGFFFHLSYCPILFWFLGRVSGYGANNTVPSVAPFRGIFPLFYFSLFLSHFFPVQ